jgi:hypothetical protein
MRVIANSVPKSGTHLLLRLLTSLGLDLVDFGGLKPTSVSGAGPFWSSKAFQKVLGTREPGKFLGIGPYLVEGGRVPPVRRAIRTSGRDKVTLGVDSPREASRRWLERRLSQVPEGSVVSAHCVYSPGFGELLREQDLEMVCILRDPRDTALSHMRYLQERPRHQAFEEYMALADDHERLMYSIRGGWLGDYPLQSLDERYRRFLDWQREAGAELVKFEDLVGPEGGGSEDAQRLATRRVAEHLGIELGEERLEEVCSGLFGKGRTFRKGQSGGWQDGFAPEHREAVKEVAGSLLVELGYEENLDW